MLSKCVACALHPELLDDVAVRVDEYVSHVTATILVAGDDEVPGVTRICLSIRGCECLALTVGITEDDERGSGREIVYYAVVGAWSVPSVRTAGDIAPDGTRMIMIGHSFVSLLFLLEYA